MNLSLIRSMTRSAVFELENGKCFRPEHPFAVALNGKTIYESCNTNVFSLFSLTPSTTYTVEVDAEGEHLKLDFTTEAESFFVDASRLWPRRRWRDRQHRQAAGCSFHLPQGRHGICPRWPLPAPPASS